MAHFCYNTLVPSSSRCRPERVTNCLSRTYRSIWPMILLYFCSVACGTAAVDQGNGQVCLGNKAGTCQACPGFKGCVDVNKCVVISCIPGDISFGGKDSSDASSKDQTVSDGNALDTDAIGDGKISDTEVIDTSPSDTGPCVAQTHKCSGSDVQICSGGKWIFLKSCPTNLVCSDGDCNCPSECPAINLVECLAGYPATRTCTLGADKCLSWSTPVACKPGEACELGLCKVPTAKCEPACAGNTICQGGVCVDKGCNPPCTADQLCESGKCTTPAVGTLSCAQVSACYVNCNDAECKTGCVGQGTLFAQQKLKSLQNCLKAVCAAAVTNDEALLCIYSNCGDEQAACLGSGSGKCKDLNDCMTSCGNNAQCTTNCQTAASKQAGIDFYTLMVCVDQNCANEQGDAQVACAQNLCASAFTKCFGGGGGGGTLTSCLQIANCQAGCKGNVPCAKQCTAAGTAKAQADVSAFIDCRDLKCANICAQDLNKCDVCMKTYCANEYAACSQ